MDITIKKKGLTPQNPPNPPGGALYQKPPTMVVSTQIRGLKAIRSTTDTTGCFR